MKGVRPNRCVSGQCHLPPSSLWGWARQTTWLHRWMRSAVKMLSMRVGLACLLMRRKSRLMHARTLTRTHTGPVPQTTADGRQKRDLISEKPASDSFEGSQGKSITGNLGAEQGRDRGAGSETLTCFGGKKDARKNSHSNKKDFRGKLSYPMLTPPLPSSGQLTGQ